MLARSDLRLQRCRVSSSPRNAGRPAQVSTERLSEGCSGGALARTPVRHRRRGPVCRARRRLHPAPDIRAGWTARCDRARHRDLRENRSFDNLYGLFPGTDGLHDAGRTIQVDRDGTPLRVLPPVWQGNAPDPLFPAHLPNAPFRIDAAPIDLPLSAPTRDLVHRFYQNQEQIDGGKLDRYAAVSDAGGLVMGTYDGAALPM
jgi:hypothetical protein